jgi:hypothetical protein
MGETDKNYMRRAVVVAIPQDVVIKGVLVVLLFCNSPPQFRASHRNGVRSCEAPLDVCAMRIASFRILTRFDDMPPIAPPFKIARRSIAVPEFRLSFTGELAVRYTPGFMMQVFSLGNISAGLFSIYCIFFDVEGARYQIVMEETDAGLGFAFQVIQLIDPLSLELLKRKSGYAPETEIITEPVSHWDVSVGPDSITFGHKVFSPISDISLLSMDGAKTIHM